MFHLPWRWSTRWALLATAVFLTEVLIALRVHDRFVRPFVGDALVVVLMHAGLRAVLGWRWQRILVGVLLFAFAVEAMQGLGLVRLLHLEDSRLWSTVLGTSADVKDLVCYAAGAGAVALGERVAARRRLGR